MFSLHPSLLNLKITVITGAGFSQPSGVPTFRGSNGLWRNYDPQKLATPSAFNQNPTLIWEWYFWRIKLIQKVQPNPAHYILAQLETFGSDIAILTQNVDDLHERAGSKNVIHLHGEIMKTRCIECGKKYKINSNSSTPLPKCVSCGGLLRPSVVWFGESLDSSVIEKSFKRLAKTDLLLIAGTSAVVYPVANFPFHAKWMNPNIEILEFNIEKTPISPLTNKTVLGPIEETLVNYFQNYGGSK